ncbi:hypothetical protein [Niabella ginsengisoli]|uniref:Uncharacterized protein n=1 Tax=Niabella ginsengisoli TaxID=522298 RepID=A0ABS9SHE0_9BACT|nr:hypothetical protein [Niabella ginsengisoli]MCH5597750.1 hypothetical protein [Niabella ginsengisoli]
MKRLILIISVFLFAIALSCGNKKDAFDTSSWYFKVKIDDKWHKLNDDLGAYLRTEAEWNWNNSINQNVALVLETTTLENICFLTMTYLL